MWMLCEGITLHFGVLDVFNEISKFKVIRYFIGWGKKKVGYFISLRVNNDGNMEAKWEEL